ncbi:MAG: hypothetical protein AVDCRST_MAG77-1978 [uncultured Chloroflexi bacterium]|uniref:Flagellar protein FliT n=1 Tax=uncultured Chloroflexota bacterium TaxID=166587 RepID=A0A6J4H060_9CHLR|nr:MAG: hypothetical protein AVDCRST_MAG77-1978 [uncultured Chloroflexota bacterium]
MSNQPTEPAGADALAAELLACYAAVRDLTARLRAAAESGQTDDLEALADERAAGVQTAEELLAALIAQRPVSGAAVLSPALTDQLEAELRALLSEDEQVRVLLSSQAQEVPRQLAELRGAHRGLGGYQRTAIDPSELVDRSG